MTTSIPLKLRLAFVAIVAVFPFANVGPSSADPMDTAQSAFLAGDFVSAERLYRLLAEKGNAAAQYNLGLLYAKGLGVRRNFEEAATWQRRSAEQGYARGQWALGSMYAEGLGLNKNFFTAYVWVALAAKQGLPQAMKTRDEIAKSMTPSELAKADKEVLDWKPKR